MKMRALSILLAFTLAAACTPTETPPEVTKPATLAMSPHAEPGPKHVSLDVAVQFFKAMCVNTLPRFKNIEKPAAANGFVKHTRFGTFYHPKYNLSVKRITAQKTCSMVFSSKEKSTALVLGMALLTTDPNKGKASISVDPGSGASRTIGKNGAVFVFSTSGRVNGKTYYRATLQATK